MNRFFFILIGVLGFVSWAQADPPPRPVPAIHKVLIISVDGLRPDLLLRGNTPVLHAMLPKSCFTFWARTTDLAITLPSHTSMLTGVAPEKHGITWNSDPPQVIYPKVPTIFQLAKKAGYTTAMVAGKSKFAALALPGSLDQSFVPHETAVKDERVCEEALKVLSNGKPDLFFVHFPEPDVMAHQRGWGSREHMEVIARTDRCIGELLAKIDPASTVVLITADHGGAGYTHGANDPRSAHIPWIIQGPGIQEGMDLTLYASRTIRTEDTFVTICFLLGIPLPEGIDGKPVTQILDDLQLNPQKYPAPPSPKFGKPSGQ